MTGFSEELRRMVDSQLAARNVPQPYVGYVVEQVDAVLNQYSVVLDGSAVPIICTRPRHIHAHPGSRVIVQRTMGRYTIVAELGGVPPQKQLHKEEASNFTAFTNTTYSSGSPVCGFSFVAPSSGSGTILIGVFCRANTNNSLRVSSAIFTGDVVGSGTSVLAASDTYCYQPPAPASGTGWNVMGAAIPRKVPAGILTPGTTYNMVVQHRITGGNGDMNYRNITWIPDNSPIEEY